LGRFIHPAVGSVWFHDRVLAHLQMVIGGKLQRRESFFLSWHDHESQRAVRSTVWIDPAVPVGFLFETDANPNINHSWLEVLTDSANSETGLQLTDEVRMEIRGDTPDRFADTDHG
jgi:hypothetical protein